MKNLFTELFMRCTRRNYRYREYTNVKTGRAIRVTTLAQWKLY